MKTPILFLVFNRPDTTKKVFAEIRKVKPDKLFVAADGPRDDKPGEKEICKEVRKITENIDWKCDVKRLYRDKNLGCRKAVSSAIDWFFENVTEGIILEDDCLPDPTFFRFCEEMLHKYRREKKVMHIGGNNFQITEDQTNKSYYFSKYSHIWGWATWRRAWKKYDVDMNNWPEIKRNGELNYIYDGWLEKKYWITIFDVTFKNKFDTWDYQWLYTCWNNDGLAVTPGVNLVKNIGFDTISTHTRKTSINPASYIKPLDFPLIYPGVISRDIQKDEYTTSKIFKPSIPLITALKLKSIL